MLAADATRSEWPARQTPRQVHELHGQFTRPTKQRGPLDERVEEETSSLPVDQLYWRECHSLHVTELQAESTVSSREACVQCPDVNINGGGCFIGKININIISTFATPWSPRPVAGCSVHKSTEQPVSVYALTSLGELAALRRSKAINTLCFHLFFERGCRHLLPVPASRGHMAG